VGWLAVIGATLIGAGLLWGQYFPINKPIWTSSYVLFAGGIGMVVLALLFMIVDIFGITAWRTIGLLCLIGATFIIIGLIWGKISTTDIPRFLNDRFALTIGILIIVFALLLKSNFFLAFGLNPMSTYLLAGIWTKTMLNVKIGEVTLYNWIFTHICSPLFEEQKIASLMFAIMQVLIIWAFGYILYRKKIIIRF
jgi:predicted acyltransferase